MLYCAVLPTYDNKTKDKGQDDKWVVDAEDPKNDSLIDRFFDD